MIKQAIFRPLVRFSLGLSRIPIQNQILIQGKQRDFTKIGFYQYSNRMFSNGNENGREEILNMLKDIKDESGKSITEMKIIHTLDVDQEGNVNIKLNLTQDYRKGKALIQDRLMKLGWVKKLQISMAPQETKTTQGSSQQSKRGLKNVKNIIAVSSCKGGVGKSTVAVNLAFSMFKLGKKVGIFDADLYGPSLPTMISPENAQLYADEHDPQQISPVMFSGIPTMSYGFAAPNKTAIMRGPMVSNLVTQLVGNTNWGELEYLVIDFPPGTGDIQLTLGQELQLRAAVIVTTPQKLAYVDVIKGIEMFDSLKVPTIAVVENMSYYKCTNCATKHKIFGQGYTNQIKEQFGIMNSFEIPIMEEISLMSDSGTPFVLALPDHLDIVQVYSQLAQSVIQEVEKDKEEQPIVNYDGIEGVIILRKGDQTKKIDPYELRVKCKCAACIDEFSGKRLFNPEKIPNDVYPTNMVSKGNYAIAVVWSDGHRSSIYSYDRMLSNEFKNLTQQS